MFGLIYKDFAANKSVAITGAVAALMTGAFFLMTAGEIPVSLFSGVLFIFIGASLLPESAMESDIKSKWNTYALTLPTTAEKAVLSKYLLLLIANGFALIIALIYMAIGSAIYSGVKFDPLFILTVFGFILIVDTLTYALKIRFGSKKGGIIRILIVIIIPLAAIMYLFFGDLTIFGENGMSDFLEWVSAFDFAGLFERTWYLLIIVGGICFAGGYIFAVKGYRAGLER